MSHGLSPLSSSPMIRMPGQHCDRTVELLEQHDPYQLMRPGSGSEGDRQIGPLAQARREAVGAPDHEYGGRPPLRPPALQMAGEGRAGDVLSALIEDHGDGTLG